MLVRGRFVVKLSRAQVAEHVDRGRGIPFEPKPGRLMREWLSVGPPTKDWLSLAHDAHAYVGG
ncbi:MAG TPA: hypothetical protein VH062_23365 [Polyangiaceae bacterium]|jgi:hypothetical protein|nr:hypothetical protein [Polyangiaceae bacterium]